MNHPRNRALDPRETYIRRNGVLTSIIDLEAEVKVEAAQIDLTKYDDDDNEVTFMGWDSTMNKRRREKKEREEVRAAREAERWSRTVDMHGGTRPADSGVRASSASSGGISRSNASASRTPSIGPPSTVRPSIRNLGTRTQKYESEPPRKRPRPQHTTPLRSLPSPPKPVLIEQGPSNQICATRLESDLNTNLSYALVDANDFVPQHYEPPFEHAVRMALSTPRLAAESIQPGVGDLRNSPMMIQPKVEQYDFGAQMDVEDNTRPIPQDDDRDGEDDEEEANSNDEYERIYAGYDIHDESRWRPPKQNPARLDNNVIEAIEGWALLNESRKKNEYKKHKRLFRTARTEKLLRPPKCEDFIWDKLSRLREPAAMARPHEKPSRSKLDAAFGKIKSEKAIHIRASFKVAPGAINRIEQHYGWLAIASACTGGQADEPDEQPNPYNRSGSLLTWNEQYYLLEKHFNEKDYGRKYYSINDIKFNNSGQCFVSAGMDQKVCVWTQPQGSRLYSGGYSLDTYSNGVPYEVVFQPGNGESNVVAVGVKDVHIYSSLEPTAKRHKTVLNLVSNAHPTHCTGAIRWDNNRPHILYASSEPQEDDFCGVHKAFDVNRGKPKLTFNINEAGDAMAVDQVLALATRGEDKNYLRLFDITHSYRNCVQDVVLEPFPKTVSAREVSCMTFCPDGIYLALARTDNSVHIYDSRMLSKGVLQKYRHQDPRFITRENSLYGVTHAQWITMRSGQYALLSGGEDGCVRLWNPMWSSEAPSNGRKIVEVNSDIGFFSVGDPYKKEHDLVVGDSSGEITVFTGLLNHL